ncbi:unnamed protein product [Prunus armeniaca]|uniref:Uncharacterized protein n=1 Tax=Prunus armeniaca TaxID=36596 RepID=A0A6J5XF31_PRUAR|nr:unnamed protein product [Prunus armeniaca]
MSLLIFISLHEQAPYQIHAVQGLSFKNYLISPFPNSPQSKSHNLKDLIHLINLSKPSAEHPDFRRHSQDPNTFPWTTLSTLVAAFTLSLPANHSISSQLDYQVITRLNGVPFMFCKMPYLSVWAAPSANDHG